MFMLKLTIPINVVGNSNKEAHMCERCNGTGIDETGNNDLPCGCQAGERARFNVCGLIGEITGAEMKRHFLNGSPEPIELGAEDILASSLPGR